MYAERQGWRQAGAPVSLRAPAAIAPGRAGLVAGTGSGRMAVLTLQRTAGNAAVFRLLARERVAALRAPQDSVRAALAGPARPLSSSVLADMEHRLGADLSDVRVHTGHAADQATRQVHADAFTTGSHLVFGHGRYNPSSPAGRLILAHELAHVLQQRRGPVAGTNGPGTALRLSHPADRHERAAEATARAALTGTAVTGTVPASRPAVAGHPAATSLPARRAPAAHAGHTMQRHWKGYTHEHFGPLTKGGCGTGMEAELHPGDTDIGESPKVKPFWWKAFTANKPTQSFARRFLVQGHLLNHRVGGTGKSMKNLTPITKRCNSLHEKQVEKDVKDSVLKKKKVVWYKVVADYSKHPKAKDLVGTRKITGKKTVLEDLDEFRHLFAYQLIAKWKVMTGKKGTTKYAVIVNKSG